MKKRILAVIVLLVTVVLLTACSAFRRDGDFYRHCGCGEFAEQIRLSV